MPRQPPAEPSAPASAPDGGAAEVARQGRAFAERGVMGPFALDCAQPGAREALERLAEPEWFQRSAAASLDPAGGPLRWIKSLHASSRTLYDLAASPSLLDKVEVVLGPDVVLWGSEVITRSPGFIHRWHVDLEHLEWEGVTVWLALRNVTSGSSLSVITGSHHLACSPQQLAESEGLDLRDDAAVLGAAQRFAPHSELVRTAVRPGEFIVFAGRLWHGSRNDTADTRTALILQYAPPSSLVKIPMTFDLRPRWRDERPACCLVRGTDGWRRNRLLPGPPAPLRLRRKVAGALG
jgi:hypothetical protein